MPVLGKGLFAVCKISTVKRRANNKGNYNSYLNEFNALAGCQMCRRVALIQLKKMDAFICKGKFYIQNKCTDSIKKNWMLLYLRVNFMSKINALQTDFRNYFFTFEACRPVLTLF